MVNIKFPESEVGQNKNRNIYAHLYFDNNRIVDKYRCDLYVRIIKDHGSFIECEVVNDSDATFYISKDIIAMARVEDRI